MPIDLDASRCRSYRQCPSLIFCLLADRLPPFLRLAVGVDWEKTSLKPYVALLDAHCKALMEEARRRKRGDKDADVTTSEPCDLSHRLWLLLCRTIAHAEFASRLGW